MNAVSCGRFFGAAALCLVAAFGCTKKSSAPAGNAGSAQENAAQLAEAGRRSYLANCTACHNADPNKDGAIGPAVAGSSEELLRARLADASYPAGYKPKRETKAMAALPHLKDDVPALRAYLNK